MVCWQMDHLCIGDFPIEPSVVRGFSSQPCLITRCNGYPLVMTNSLPWKTTLLMGKSTISMVILNSYVNVYQRIIKRNVQSISNIQPHDQCSRIPAEKMSVAHKSTIAKRSLLRIAAAYPNPNLFQ